MKERVSETRRHLIDVAENLLLDRDSNDMRVADVAVKADVGVQSIYYHFGSIGRLIAEAQASAYLRLTEPLHRFLAIAENALAEEDQLAFWNAVGDDLMLAWSYGSYGDGWRISRLLIDVRSEPNVRREFSERLDLQFDRWTDVIEAAKLLGWISKEIDANAFVATCWAASNGQAIFSFSSKQRQSPQSIRDLFLSIAATKQ